MINHETVYHGNIMLLFNSYILRFGIFDLNQFRLSDLALNTGKRVTWLPIKKNMMLLNLSKF